MNRTFALTCFSVALAVTGCSPGAADAGPFIAAPAAFTQAEEKHGQEIAVFAGGCFWSVEAVFSHVKGVSSVVSGYHGGTQRSARYDLVTSGITDHVEAVRITYDPAVIRYDQLLQVFFSVVANPTLGNGQRPDIGSEYTAQVIPVSAQQLSVAKAYLAQLKTASLWSAPIVTPIVRAQAFYSAEQEHQDFAARKPRHGYVQRWSTPKVAALKRLYPGVYSATFRRG